MSEVTDRIDILIAERKMSKMKFYKECGFTPSAYSLWKKGKASPNWDNIETIANVLNSTSAYIAYGVKGQKLDSSLQSLMDDERTLLCAYRNMTESDKKMMQTFIRGLQRGETD